MNVVEIDLNSDELVAKRANLERVKEFAKNLENFNKQSLQQQPKLPPSTEASQMVVAKGKQESKREKALQFAKKVPKPKSRLPSTNARSETSEDALDDMENDELMMNNFHGNIETRRLDELEAKHNDKKRQVEAIKKSLGF